MSFAAPKMLRKDNRPSSFDIDRAEGGTKLVSADLGDKLSAHGASDEVTLQFLWKMNIWSVADLQGVDTETLVQVA
jgi:hypothetical protein